MRDELAQPPADWGLDAGPPVAYFCAEFGVHDSLPVYAGGLGALAGDLLKEASDRALPIVAIGLIYRQGYFRQRLDASAAGSTSTGSRPTRSACRPRSSPTTTASRSRSTSRSRDPTSIAQIWRVDVGRVPLYLLDVDRPGELACWTRWIASRLYVGDPRTRLAQYVAARRRRRARAARARHRARRRPPERGPRRARPARARARGDGANGASLDEALESAALARRSSPPTRRCRRATTRTRPTRCAPTVAQLVDADRRRRRRRDRPGAQPPRGRRRAVRRHPARAADEPLRERRLAPPRRGRARRCGASCGPAPPGRGGADRPRDQRRARADLARRRTCARCSTATSARTGSTRQADPETWKRDRRDLRRRAVGRCATASARELVDFVRERSVADRLGRVDTRRVRRRRRARVRPRRRSPSASRAASPRTSASACSCRTRRGILALLGGDRPIQVVLAGKAHPRDEEAKHMLQRMFGLQGRGRDRRARRVPRRLRPRLGAALVRGCDIWLNVPRPPLEASGTSGMKSVMNGGLQLSVLDGWWAEAYDGDNGWAIPRQRRPRPRRRRRARRRRALPRCSSTRSCRRSTTAADDGHPGRVARADARVAADERAALQRHADAARLRRERLHKDARAYYLIVRSLPRGDHRQQHLDDPRRLLALTAVSTQPA